MPIIIGAISFIMYCYYVGNPNNRYINILKDVELRYDMNE